MGSGCFIEYKGVVLFLTVYHTVKDYSLDTMIVTDFDVNKGVKLLSVGIIPPTIKGNLNTKYFSDIDFACVKLNNMPKCYFFNLDEYGKIVTRYKRISLKTCLTDVPINSETYGFAGFIRGKIKNNCTSKFNITLCQELAYYDNLKYIGTNDDYYIFSLPNKNYNNDNFKGTSGAPILDSNGKLVSLVACGCPSEDGKQWLIYGFNLEKYKILIDIECGFN